MYSKYHNRLYTVGKRVNLMTDAGDLDTGGASSGMSSSLGQGLQGLSSSYNVSGMTTPVSAGRGKAGGLFGDISSSVDLATKFIYQAAQRDNKPIAQAIGLAYGGNLFANGGDYAAAGADAMQLVGNAINNSKTLYTDDQIAQIKGSIQSKVDDVDSSYDDLESTMANWTDLQHVSWKDIYGRNNTQDVANAISAGNTGATTGMSVGGSWGAAIGGILGTGSSIIGSLAGRHKAKKQARAVNKEIDLANARADINFITSADQISYNQMANLERNYAAEGGSLKKKKKDKDSFMRYLAAIAQNSYQDLGQTDPETAMQYLMSNENFMNYYSQVPEENLAASIADIPAEYNVYAEGGDTEDSKEGTKDTRNKFDVVVETIVPQLEQAGFNDNEIRNLINIKARETGYDSELDNNNLWNVYSTGSLGKDERGLARYASIAEAVDSLIRESLDKKFKGWRTAEGADALADALINYELDQSYYNLSDPIRPSDPRFKKLVRDDYVKFLKGQVSINKALDKYFANRKPVQEPSNDTLSGLHSLVESSYEAEPDALYVASPFIAGDRPILQNSDTVDPTLIGINNLYQLQYRKPPLFDYTQEYPISSYIAEPDALRVSAPTVDFAPEQAPVGSWLFQLGIEGIPLIMNSPEYRYQKAFGGELNTNGADFTNGLLSIDAGGSHSENSLGGVPMGTDMEGTPNLVEEGETVYNDYVFSKRLKVPKELNKRYGIGKKKEVSFAEASKKIAKESEERPNDPISQRGLDALLGELTMIQEMVKSQNQQQKQQSNGQEANVFSGEQPYSSQLNLNNEWTLQAPASVGSKNGYLSTNKLRFAPAYGYGIQSLMDALGFNGPDYSNADAVINAGRRRTYKSVGFNPVGERLQYRPIDRLYQYNQMAAQNNATRRALLQNAGMNRGAGMAAILAADKNATTNLGNAYIAGQQYNDNLRQAVAKFNAGQSQYNSTGAMQASQANAELYDKAASDALAAIKTGYRMREDERNAVDAAHAANRSGFYESLGQIGKENLYRDLMKWGMENGLFENSNSFETFSNIYSS